MKRSSVQYQERQRDREPAVPLPNHLDPASTVESVVKKAQQISAHKAGTGNIKILIDLMKAGNYAAISYYNYYVVKQLAEVLSSWDKNIKAIYTHDYDGATPEEACIENTSSYPLIRLIIWAERKTKATYALVETIDHAMVQHHRQILGLNNLERALDVQVIDDEDVKNRTGYAALLNSIYQPPVQVWCNIPDI